MLLAEATHILIIAMYVLQELVQPFRTFVICRLQRYDAKGIDVAYLVDVYGTVYLGTTPGIGTHDVGYLQSGYIESLAWRHTADGMGISSVHGAL